MHTSPFIECRCFQRPRRRRRADGRAVLWQLPVHTGQADGVCEGVSSWREGRDASAHRVPLIADLRAGVMERRDVSLLAVRKDGHVRRRRLANATITHTPTSVG